MEFLFGPMWLPCLICFIAGIVLLVVELCMPGFGVAGFSGIACCIAVIVMQYTTNSPLVASIVSLVMLAIIIFLAILLIRSLNSGKLFRSPIVLKDKIESDASVASSVPPDFAEISKRSLQVSPSASVISSSSQTLVIAVVSCPL